MIFTLLLSFIHCERSFKIVGNEFQMDGKPFRYVSGSFHYFRQHPNYWDDTMKKMRNGGCNTLQTYVAWNVHEPRKGEYHFDGFADIERFIQLAQQNDLYVILRPGPYICAEWDFGGLPYWLYREDKITVRSSNSVFMSHVTTWFKELFTRLKPYMYHNGGNIIMVQIENEFGSYAPLLGDHLYLEKLCDLTEQLLGTETQLFTTDGPSSYFLRSGSITKRAYATVDFGVGDPTSNFETERYWNNGKGPYVNSEFYTGWLDHWTEEHHTVDTESVCATLDKMLSMNASVNMYMYIGGTNFFYYNGANGDSSSYQVDPTSYDYDAPLNEAGDMTWKYQKIRDVIKKYFDVPSISGIQNSTKKNFGKIEFNQAVSLFDCLSIVGAVDQYTDGEPLTMEDLNVDFGFVLYQTNITAGEVINIPHCKDRGYIFVNRQLNCIVQHAEEKKCNLLNGTGHLDILVENMGRLNYGGQFYEKKGLTSGVKLDGKSLKKWRMVGFNLTNINKLTFGSSFKLKEPSFYRAEFDVDEVADTFLNPSGWTRGVVFVNGFNIGRYWTVGPQLTLYVPKYLLQKGKNEIIVFEFESQFDVLPTMSLDDVHQIDIN